MLCTGSHVKESVNLYTNHVFFLEYGRFILEQFLHFVLMVHEHPSAGQGFARRVFQPSTSCVQFFISTAFACLPTAGSTPVA